MHADSIKVYVRFKPSENFLEPEISTKVYDDLATNHLSISSDYKTVNVLPYNLVKSTDRNEEKEKIPVTSSIANMRTSSYTFDGIFPGATTQEALYKKTIEPLLDSFLDGYNATIICYGQTGSGKTYTMMGNIDDTANRGIIPRLFDTIFQKIYESPITFQYTIALSYFEIYNEEIIDLLSLEEIGVNTINIREIPDKDRSKNPVIYVEGLEKVYIANVDDIHKVITLGNNRRKQAETGMNRASSRSHTMLRVELSVHKDSVGQGRVEKSNTEPKDEEETIYQSTLFLVDLAGSERISKSGTNSSITTMKETIGINSSLSALGHVINALGADSRANNIGSGQEKARNKSFYTPYRDSKLTRVLQNSLGGNTKTAMIVNCSSDISDLNETISSLRFAQRAKNVQNLVKVNRLIIKPQKVIQRNDSVSKDSNDLAWKSKYVNALRKIVDLETRLEISKVKRSGNNIAGSDSLLQEKRQLLNENEKYNKNLSNDLNDDPVSETTEFKNYISRANRIIDSLKSDVEVYKKLLVSKTDRILQLESELNGHPLDEDNFSIGDRRLMREMTDTIEEQNEGLKEQVKRAELALKQKESLLNEKNAELAARNATVFNEQIAVEEKLDNMRERLMQVTESDENSHRDNKEDAGIYAQDTTENSQTPENIILSPRNINTCAGGGKKKINGGINLQIVKPRS